MERWMAIRSLRPSLVVLLGRAVRIGPALTGFALAGFALAIMLGTPAAAWATDLQVSGVSLEPCPQVDVGSQPTGLLASGAACYALRGQVINASSSPVVDTDVFARILDASGEAVLPNRARVGSIGDVPVGTSSFALRLAIPAGTPGPFAVRGVKARGFRAPVRTRVQPGEELLPLEQAVAPSAQ